MWSCVGKYIYMYIDTMYVKMFICVSIIINSLYIQTFFYSLFFFLISLDNTHVHSPIVGVNNKITSFNMQHLAWWLNVITL